MNTYVFQIKFLIKQNLNVGLYHIFESKLLASLPAS